MATKTDKVKIIVGAKDQTKGVLSGIKSQVLGIGAAYLGWRGVTSIISSITEAGRENEKVWNDVAASLERHGIEVDSNLAKIQTFADEMQTLSGESDEAIGKMVQSFVDYGQTVDEAMETAKVAMDLAAGSGMELKAASDLLAKAAVGYTGTLSRYGIIIDETIPKQEKFAAAIEQITERFGGAAVARMDTYDVMVKLLTERFGDLQENMFKAFSGTFLSSIDSAISVIGVLDDAVSFLWGETEVVTTKFEDWTSEIKNLRQQLDDGKISVEEFTTAIQGIGQAKKEPIFTTEEILSISLLAENFGLAADNTSRLGTTLGLSAAQFKAITDEMKNFKDEAGFEAAIAEAEQAAALLKERLANEALLRINSEIEVGLKLRELRKEILDESLTDVEEFDEDLQFMADNQFNRLVENTKKELAVFDATNKKKLETQKRFEQISVQILSSGVDQMVDKMWDGQQSFDDIFKTMADHFMKFFIKQSLAFIANAFIPGLGVLLGGIFDTPANDKMAETQGLHFAQFFSSGAMEEFKRFADEFPKRLAIDFGGSNLPAFAGAGGAIY